MAYILHIDTATDNSLVALSRDGQLLSAIENNGQRNHASFINNHIDEVLKTAGIGLQQLSAIALCGGPGSYTGLRIGLATAKGICYALHIPLMMHSRLLLLVLKVFYNNSSEYEFFGAILTAREKEYFFSLYNNKLEPVVAPAHFTEDELTNVKQKHIGKILLAGDITDVINNLFQSDVTGFYNKNVVDATAWASYAFQQFNCNSFVNLPTAEPYYLKQVYTHNSKKNN
jgi:tRNA threonylcarbamoyladenosine biosynthesis protein TsaB